MYDPMYSSHHQALFAYLLLSKSSRIKKKKTSSIDRAHPFIKINLPRTVVFGASRFQF